MTGKSVWNTVHLPFSNQRVTVWPKDNILETCSCVFTDKRHIFTMEFCGQEARLRLVSEIKIRTKWIKWINKSDLLIYLLNYF